MPTLFSDTDTNTLSHQERHSFFHAFCRYPRVHFDSQRPNEEVVLVVRAHPLTQLPWVLNTFFLVVLILLLDVLFLPRVLLPNQIFVANAFGFVFTFSYFWYNALLWFGTVGIVTTERVIDIDFYNILYKEVSSTNLDEVADVTAKVGGFAGSFFQYGTVYIMTAGTHQDIEFEQIPNPTQAVTIINDLVKNQHRR